jgi:hypothetical protein
MGDKPMERFLAKTVVGQIVISINDQAQRAGVVVDTDHSMFVKTVD